MKVIDKKHLFLVILGVQLPAFSEIYKCPTVNGSIEYKSVPCDKGYKNNNGRWESVEKERIKKQEQQIKDDNEKRKAEEILINRANEKKQRKEREKKNKNLRKLKHKKFITKNFAVIQAISSSDDFYRYKYEFVKVSKYLIDHNKCTLSELKYIGGWVKSTKTTSLPLYFTYCGNGKMSASNKDNQIYFNPKKGTLYGVNIEINYSRKDW